MSDINLDENFIDDRLNVDMTEIRKIMKKNGTNPVFRIEFVRNSFNNIAVRLACETNTMPSETKQISSLDQIGDIIEEYIKDTALWV